MRLTLVQTACPCFWACLSEPIQRPRKTLVFRWIEDVRIRMAAVERVLRVFVCRETPFPCLSSTIAPTLIRPGKYDRIWKDERVHLPEWSQALPTHGAPVSLARWHRSSGFVHLVASHASVKAFSSPHRESCRRVSRPVRLFTYVDIHTIHTAQDGQETI